MVRVSSAFQRVDRADFLPLEQRDEANDDRPIPIGYGQTNSQPSTVRRMIAWLDPRPGDKVLDLGSGSGWTTALLSCLVGKNGFVYAVEKIPELLTFGSRNCSKYHFENVEFHQAGDVLGLPSRAPFDRILVSAAADSLPHPLVSQLAVGGCMVMPVGNTVFEIHKTSDTDFDTIEHHGYIFVPLVGWLR